MYVSDGRDIESGINNIIEALEKVQKEVDLLNIPKTLLLSCVSNRALKRVV